MRSPALLAEAALPPGANLNWDETTIQPLNAKRARLSLDGIWRFTPAAGGPPPALGWRYIKVPGDCQDHSNRPSSIIAPGTGLQWEHHDGSYVTRTWYERQVTIPAEWQGRAICLRLDRVCTDAIVTVNGTECGRGAWPWGSVEITRAVTPGRTANTRLLVAAIADPDQVGRFWQNALSNDLSYSASRLETRGITGSVFLESRASDTRVTDVNGVPVGHTDVKTPGWWQTPRHYPVPGKLVKAGRNVIAVRLFDRFNEGGFAGNGGLPMSLASKPAGSGEPAYYHPNYRTNCDFGDNPYRHYRW